MNDEQFDADPIGPIRGIALGCVLAAALWSVIECAAFLLGLM